MRVVRTELTEPEYRLLLHYAEKHRVTLKAALREVISQRVKQENERNLAEAVLLNEKLRRRAPKGWDSMRVIRDWRNRRVES